MPIVYSAATKTARMNAVVSSIGVSGFIKFYTSNGGTLLATFALAVTAGTVSGNVLTFSDANGVSADIMNTTASAPGTATYARITTAADADVVTGLTVGTSGTDFVIDNNVFTVGQTIALNSAALTHA
jgi:hypothetical protein